MARQAGARKCDYCKELISVKNKNKLDNVLRYKNKFYHEECFIELAESRVAAQNRYSASWQEALDNIDQLVEEAKTILVDKEGLKSRYPSIRPCHLREARRRMIQRGILPRPKFKKLFDK